VVSRVARFRLHKDEYFADGENSPLEPEDIAGFSGLAYFDENTDLVFSLELDRGGPGVNEVVELDTSDGLVVEFTRAGEVRFAVNGQGVKLTVFKDRDRGRFFLPFADATSGTSTYSEGRYLDPQIDANGKLTVDFNFAYNPYCAYSEGWSCPLPPEENRLTISIEAGEKHYDRPVGDS
jgi:uncharacterized protein